MQPQTQPETYSDSPPQTQVQFSGVPGAPWSRLTKIAFRFGFIYFGLYNLETALDLLRFPPFKQLSSLYSAIRGNAVHWVSKHILHLSHDFSTDFLNTAIGSKDTTYAYVQVLCFLILATVATLVWSLWDRKRQDYTWLHKWFVVYLRLSLVAALIPYGAAKIFPVQFPAASLSQLVTPLGNLTPSQMMQASMGTSASYTFFGGLMEIAAGLLLAVPSLATVGALLSTALMGNVLMLNLGYDFVAKLMATNLLLMSVVILLPQLARLADFFVLNRTVPSMHYPPLFQRRSLARAALVLQIAFGIVLLSYTLYRSHAVAAEQAASRKTPLYGIWLVDEYSVNGQPVAPLSSDSHRWQRIIVNSEHDAIVQVMTGVSSPLFLRSDPRNNRLVLTQSGNPNWIAELTYDNSQPGFLVLKGRMGGVPVMIRLHREDESKFPLNNHRVRLIQDAGEY